MIFICINKLVLFSRSFHLSLPGVALLPFVDEKRLHKALESVYPDLSERESKRNCLNLGPFQH
jgi:5'-3' exonuclease